MTIETRTDPGRKSAAELEHEVAAQRAEVEHDLDKLQDRLSPGQLMDQLFDYVKHGNGADFTRNLGRSIRDNPIPVALMGIGMAWLMVGGSGTKPRNVDDDPHDRDWDDRAYAYSGDPVDLGGFGQSYGEASAADLDQHTADEPEGSRREGLTSKAGRVAGHLRDRAGEASECLGGGIRGTRDAMARRGRGVGRKTRRYGDRLGRRASRYGRQARRRFFEALEDQPLVLGALGVAIGAALGAALPATEREDELMGETRDNLKRQAEQTGRKQEDKVRDMADAAYGAAKEEADRQGLTAEAGESGVRSMKDKAAKVASTAKAAADREAAET